MSPEQLFSIANTIALVSWLLLAILPRRRWVSEVVTGKVVPGLLAAVFDQAAILAFHRWVEKPHFDRWAEGTSHAEVSTPSNQRGDTAAD